MSIVGENIRAIRQKAGLTQEAMAEKLGIKRSLLGAYEEGRATPRLEVLTVYSDLSGVTIADLVNRALPARDARNGKPQRGRPRKGTDPDHAKAPLPEQNAYAGSPTFRPKEPDLEGGSSRQGHQAYPAGQEIRVLTITQGQGETASFEVIAAASLRDYVRQRAIPSFLSRQPRMCLPFLKAGEVYRAFGGNGGTPADRMLVCSFVRNWITLNSKETYILATHRDLIHGRLENRLSQSESLLIESGRSLSDGKAVTGTSIAGQDVLEIWKVEYVLSATPQNEPELSSRLSRIESYLGL